MLHLTAHQIKEEKLGDKYCTNDKHGRSAHRILDGQPEVGEHLGYLGADKRVILKWISDKLYLCGGDSSGFVQGVAVYFCEHAHKSQDYVKGE
jgi:hypothetical protein